MSDEIDELDELDEPTGDDGAGSAAEDVPDTEFPRLLEKLHTEHNFDFRQYKEVSLLRRIRRRMAQLHVTSFATYIHYLDRNADEYKALLDVILINVTRFFRDPEAWNQVRERVLPRLIEEAASNQSLRIWSAGCSSGEEPYTIAMLLQQAGWYDKAAFEIFASDINQAVLAKARRGQYRENAFRATDPALRERFFARDADGSWKISDEIRNRISFGRLNLYDESRVSLLGHLDVVFCRNVIIYFDDASKKVVVSNFYNRLVEGGYLLLGHSESLISLSTQFKLRHLKNDMVYQK